ncbi:hypothetical protein CIT292_09640 [Citrobacter youngae ATCC 29220]|uniref:Uncharacterized protein n=1 Tax=Citrobacter youngae ATCC 29220 TaxID=500640 RepID=D4BGJ2_9ENTR|nr:hypothetical protein CIT292_09640 [Citrobacter youngae ATCC 29220]
MTFPQHGDANVHIAAILFFDMLKRRMKIPHTTHQFEQKRQGRGNGKGITGER